MLITFEGIDGSGKTTLVEKIIQEFKTKEIFVTKEPTKDMEAKDPLALAFLFMADRVEHTGKIKKRIKEGKIVLCDRYCDSTYAYQGVLISEKYNLEINKTIEYLKKAHDPFVLKPDVTFLLDVSAKTGVERKGGSDEKFLERVRNVYLKLAKEEKRFVVLDGRKDQKDLVDEVLKILGPKF